MATVVNTEESSARNSARALAVSLITARLKELMAEQSIRGARQLARRSGIGVGTAANLLSGESEPTLSTMLLLAAALELHSIEELIAPLGTARALSSLPADRLAG